MLLCPLEDEIAEIGQSARGKSWSPQNDSSLNHTATSENRASSMGSVDTCENDFEKGGLLVDFPSQGASASTRSMDRQHDDGAGPSFSKAKQRNSVSLNPLSMRSALAGLEDLVDSDDDEYDHNKYAQTDKPPSPLPLSNPKASGGPDHRPLVGGFAAAAYEAARVDYYKKQGKGVRGHGTPKPRPHYPRCPQYP